MLSIEQQRAAFSWGKVQNINKEYENLAKSAPALIMNNGLMQTLAFFQSKGREHHNLLNNHIFEWLAGRFDTVPKPPYGRNSGGFLEVMNALRQMDSMDYQRATEEVLALLRWLRQFAAAVMASD